MAKRLKAGGFAITVEVPASVSQAARRLLGKSKGSVLEPGGLFVSPDVPSLDVVRRDPERTVSAFRSNNPDTEGASDALGEGATLAEKVEAFDWYHTIDLPSGLVTKGVYDHRPLVPLYGIPEDLTGKRVLDVATFDGFWAFEFERRGALVEAVDLEWLSQVDFPPKVREMMIAQGLDQRLGLGFTIAAEALGSKVKRHRESLYDMDPDRMGTFDLVHIADVLLHLERPLDALRAVRRVTSGEALIVDTYNPTLDDPSGRTLTHYVGGWWDVTWWLPSLDTLAQMVIDAGFSDVQLHKIYTIAKRGETGGYWRAILKAKP